MSSSFVRVLFVVALAPSGCAGPSPVDVAAAASLTERAPIDAFAGAQIVGASADRRFVAYAAPCTPDQQEAPSLRLYDDWTGGIFTLGAGQCRPDAVRFSPDGQLAAFGGGDGVARVFSARTATVTVVTRADQRTFGLGFSPDSRWLVVASSAGEPSQGAMLEAWDADLVHHVEISENAYVNPFGADPVRFSSDGRRILFLDGATTPFPLGALTLWERRGRRSTVLAEGVAGFAVDDDFDRVAYLGGVVYQPGQPPSVWLRGTLAVRRLGDGHVDTLETDASAQPITFTADGTLVYFDGAPGQPVGLRAAARGGRPVSIDDGIFAFYGTTGGIAVNSRGEIAYAARFDPQHATVELRVATLPGAGRVARAPTSVVADAVPMAFGWGDASTLVYLHAPLSSFPGAQVGTLAAWSATGARQTIAQQVTQTGLRFDASRERVLYVAAWDANRAAGDLSIWSARTRRHRLLDHDAFVMTLMLSPDGDSAGVLTVGRGETPGTPPPLALDWMSLEPVGPAHTLGRDATSFTVGDGGRVLYTTSAGLVGAFTR